MAITAGTKIIEDGLILNIDPANEKAVQTGSLEVEYLIVAGGGGGGGSPHGAGGGAGGLIAGKQSVSNSSHSIVVGSGGAGKIGEFSSPWPPPGTNFGSNGSDSTAFGLTAIGGGGGGGYSGSGGADTVGKSGGSGGGTGRDPSSVGQAQQPGSASGGFGNAGGRGGYSFAVGSSRNVAGGGGGAGEQAYLRGSLIESLMGHGGDGLSSFITGSKTFYAGGGGGSNYLSTTAETHPPGGVGGGGVGDSQTTPLNSSQRSGAANTGGGGGGAERNSSGDATGGSGGSGVVIVRYKGAQQASGGDSIYQSGPYTVHVFNNSGNFVVGGAVGDVSGNSNGGAINGATYNVGNQGYYSFDGTDDYITLGTKDIITNDFTVSMWVRPTATTKELYFFSFGYFDSTSALLFRDSSSPYNLIALYRQGGVNTNASSGTVISANTTYNLVWTRAGSTNTLYVNNESVHTFTNSTSLVSCIYDIGWATTRNKSTAYFQGNIYNTLLYNRALTAEEVTQNFEAMRGRFGV